MYSVPLPVYQIRTRIRQEFERHRYVNKLPIVDRLIFKSHVDYQVSQGLSRTDILEEGIGGRRTGRTASRGMGP